VGCLAQANAVDVKATSPLKEEIKKANKSIFTMKNHKPKTV
jgi:hypothetical protein